MSLKDVEYVVENLQFSIKKIRGMCIVPTTIKNIKGTEIPPSLRNRFNVKDYQILTVTIEIEDDNMWDTVIESARQTYKDLKMGEPISTMQDVLKGL